MTIYNKRLVSKLELSYDSQLFAVYNGFIRVAVDDSVNVCHRIRWRRTMQGHLAGRHQETYVHEPDSFSRLQPLNIITQNNHFVEFPLDHSFLVILQLDIHTYYCRRYVPG